MTRCMNHALHAAPEDDPCPVCVREQHTAAINAISSKLGTTVEAFDRAMLRLRESQAEANDLRFRLDKITRQFCGESNTVAADRGKHTVTDYFGRCPACVCDDLTAAQSRLDSEKKDYAETCDESAALDLKRREQLLELCEIAVSGEGTSQFTHARAALTAIREKAHRYASQVATFEYGEHSERIVETSGVVPADPIRHPVHGCPMRYGATEGCICYSGVERQEINSGDGLDGVEPCPHGFIMLAGTCPKCDAEEKK